MVDINKLIDDLASENEATRSFAVDDLGRLNNSRAVIPLVELLLKEKSIIIRESIFKSLAQIEGGESITALVKLVRSNDAFIRNQATMVLNIKGTEAIESLKDLLKDPDKDVRKLALDALFSFEHPESARIIAQALSDPAINIRITAVEYLGRLEAKEFSKEVDEILKGSNNILLTCSCLEALAIIGNDRSLEITQELFSDLNKIDPLIQFSYIKVLGALGTHGSLELFTDILEKYGAVFSKEVINAVQKVTARLKIESLPDNLLESFIHILDDMDEMDEYAVLNLLSAYKNEKIYPLILKKLKSEKRMVKLGAIESLGKYGNADAISNLESLLDDEEDEELVEVISDSIETLKERGPCESIG